MEFKEAVMSGVILGLLIGTMIILGRVIELRNFYSGEHYYHAISACEGVGLKEASRVYVVCADDQYHKLSAE